MTISSRQTWLGSLWTQHEDSRRHLTRGVVPLLAASRHDIYKHWKDAEKLHNASVQAERGEGRDGKLSTTFKKYIEIAAINYNR